MRAQGIDISRWQKSYNSAVKFHDFVIMRSSFGVSEDLLYEQYFNSCSDVEVVGAYHYFTDDYIEMGDDFWEPQFEVFMDITFFSNTPEFYALDFEKYGNSPSMRFGQGAKAFIDAVQQETNAPCLLYTNSATYQEWLTHYGQYWMNDYPYWCAQWPYYGWNDNLNYCYSGEWNPRLPAGQLDWKFWQFSGDGNGKGAENGVGSADVDLDVFNGTIQDMRVWLQGEDPKPEEEYVITVTGKDININVEEL